MKTVTANGHAEACPSSLAFLGKTVSVVVVSDYGSDAAGGWGYLRDAVTALARQQSDVSVEVLLVDAAPGGQHVPAEIVALLPTMRVVAEAGKSTRELLNEAVRAASAELVVLLDGDCVPAPRWLNAAVEAMRARADAAAVSGLTVYPDFGLTNRVLGALSRAFVDPGGAGQPTRFISTNNVVFRREVLLDHVLPAFGRVMAERLQAEAIRSAGGALYFEPAMRVTHRFDGWAMERRIRRNVGYRVVRVRQIDPRTPHAWMMRLGPVAIPVILAARWLDSVRNCLRSGHYYGVRWFELPAAFGLAGYVHLLEIDGMRAAFAEASAQTTQGENAASAVRARE